MKKEKKKVEMEKKPLSKSSANLRSSDQRISGMFPNYRLLLTFEITSTY